MRNLFILCLYLLLPIDSAFSQDQEYQIPEIDINVEILEDGIVQIEEQRTYQFQGSFSWADYRLPKMGYSEIRNIRVREQDTDFINENTEETGTYSVSESDDAVIIKWHYSASDTRRIFTVSYELYEALSIGPQWTEFFWNYIASGREKSTDNLDIAINLPEEISPDSLFAWIRTSADQAEIDKRPGKFEIIAQDLSTSQSLKVRSVFPSAVFDMNSVSVTDPELTLEWIQNDETAYIREQKEKAERQAYYSSIAQEVTVLICVLSLAIFILLFRKYGTRHSTGTLSDRETVLIPGSLPPAVIGRLMGNSSTTGRHLVATLFDLSRRGWFTIMEEENVKEGFFFTSESTQFRIQKTEPQPDDSLPEWEKMIVDHVNSQIENGHNLFEELFKDGDFKMSKWFPEWKKKVKNVFDQKKWIDKESYRGVILNIVAQIILLAIAIIMLILGDNKLALIGLFVSVLALAVSFAIVRKTKEGQETYKRWKAYREGLKNADKRTIRMEILDRHFIYAMAFHFSERQIETMVKSADDSDFAIFPWIILMTGSNHTPASIAATVTTLASTSTSAFPGTSGGAGASAGAAGGGASGGAG